MMRSYRTYLVETSIVIGGETQAKNYEAWRRFSDFEQLYR